MRRERGDDAMKVLREIQVHSHLRITVHLLHDGKRSSEGASVGRSVYRADASIEQPLGTSCSAFALRRACNLLRHDQGQSLQSRIQSKRIPAALNRPKV